MILIDASIRRRLFWGLGPGFFFFFWETGPGLTAGDLGGNRPGRFRCFSLFLLFFCFYFPLLLVLLVGDHLKVSWSPPTFLWLATSFVLAGWNDDRVRFADGIRRNHSHWDRERLLRERERERDRALFPCIFVLCERAVSLSPWRMGKISAKLEFC